MTEQPAVPNRPPLKAWLPNMPLLRTAELAPRVGLPAEHQQRSSPMFHGRLLHCQPCRTPSPSPERNRTNGRKAAGLNGSRIEGRGAG